MIAEERYSRRYCEFESQATHTEVLIPLCRSSVRAGHRPQTDVRTGRRGSWTFRGAPNNLASIARQHRET